jgi:hypothetical protein
MTSSCADKVGANAPQGLDAAHARHRDIHDRHVRRQLGIEPAGGFAGVGLRNHRYVRNRLQQQSKAHAHHRVIVDQQDANHAGTASGMSAERSTPRVR